MAYNGQQRNIKRDNYGYAERVAQITKDTETLLGQLPCTHRVLVAGFAARISLPLAATPIGR
jgi:hypothetical protein